MRLPSRLLVLLAALALGSSGCGAAQFFQPRTTTIMPTLRYKVARGRRVCRLDKTPVPCKTLGAPSYFWIGIVYDAADGRYLREQAYDSRAVAVAAQARNLKRVQQQLNAMLQTTTAQ